MGFLTVTLLGLALVLRGYYGSEFLNYHLLEYMQERENPVQFTRSRPYHKGDNAHVEQKNWTHVRQLFGYYRFEDQNLVALMNDLYQSELSLLHNYFYPAMKLQDKIRINAKIKKLTIDKWLKVKSQERRLILEVDPKALDEVSQLDGCYVIKTNVKESPEATSKIIHDRYKDLALVEWAFRTCKEDFLEIRPHYVRKATRTEGHVFVVMLAYKIIRCLAQCWRDIAVTIEEGIKELDSICLNTIKMSGGSPFKTIPQPRPLGKKLLEALDIQLPKVIPDYGITVSPRKKLIRHASKRHKAIHNESEINSAQNA